MIDFSNAPVLDMKKALYRVHNKQELLEKVILVFKKNLLEKKETIATELVNENWESLKLISHSLKGSSWTIGAQRLGDIAYAMEKASASKDLPLFNHLFTILQNGIDQVFNYLAENGL